MAGRGLDQGFEHNARAAQGAVSQCHRYAPDDLVKHFVPSHDAQRVGTGIPIDLDAEHEIVIEQVVRIRCRY